MQLFHDAKHHPQDASAPAVQTAFDALDRTRQHRTVALAQIQCTLRVQRSCCVQCTCLPSNPRYHARPNGFRPRVVSLLDEIPDPLPGDVIRGPAHQVPERVSGQSPHVRRPVRTQHACRFEHRPEIQDQVRREVLAHTAQSGKCRPKVGGVQRLGRHVVVGRLQTCTSGFAASFTHAVSFHASFVVSSAVVSSDVARRPSEGLAPGSASHAITTVSTAHDYPLNSLHRPGKMRHKVARQVPAQVNQQIQQRLERQRIPHVQPRQKRIKNTCLMIYQLWQCRTQRLHLFVELKPVVRSVELSPRHQVLLEKRTRTRTGSSLSRYE